MQGEYVNRIGTLTTGTGTASQIDAANEVLIVSVEDLENVSALVIQATDAGTVTLALTKSYDGTLFVPFGASIAESDFTAGNNTAIERTLSDGNGMPTMAKLIKLTASALASGGVYKLQVSGKKRAGF